MDLQDQTNEFGLDGLDITLMGLKLSISTALFPTIYSETGLNYYSRSRESLNIGAYKSKKKNKLKSITEGEELTNYGIV